MSFDHISCTEVHSTNIFKLVILGLIFLGFAPEFANAHCRLQEATLGSLQTQDRQRIDVFHQRVKTAEYELQRTIVWQEVRIIVPPPVVPPTDDGSGGSFGDLNYEPDSCAALYDLIADTYNSVFCHLKAHAENQDVSEHIMCLSSYPGMPTKVSNAMRVYSVATDDEPLSAFLKEVSDDLVDLIGEEFVCDGSTTNQEYARNVIDFKRAQYVLEGKMAEYEGQPKSGG